MSDPYPILDANSLLVAQQYFGHPVEAFWDLLEPAFEQGRLAADERLIRQGDLGDTLFIVVEGRLRVVAEKGPAEDVVLTHIEPGDSVGEIALLTGERRTASVYAEVATRLLSLSCQKVDEITARVPEAGRAISSVLIRHVHQTQLNHVLLKTNIFRGLDEEVFRDLQAEIELVSVPSGASIMRTGDAADAVYIVIGGRLRVVSQDSDQGQLYSVETGPGQTVGEIGLITGERRSATVFALRDTLLARLSQASFRKLLQRHPEAILAQFAAPIIARLRDQLSGAVVKTGAVTTIAVIGVDRDVPLMDFTAKFVTALRQLGSTKHLDRHRCAEQLGSEEIADLTDGDPQNDRFTFWLNEQEVIHDFVVFAADFELTRWTERCIRQADLVLIVSSVNSSSQPCEIESRLLLAADGAETSQCLILLQDGATQLPVGTNRWLAARNVRAHYHVRMQNKADFARVSRMVTGRGIGLVLSGGGARALAHIGVIRALEERGVPIDAIGAVSGGAIVAGLWGMGLNYPDILRRSSEATDRVDYTLPIHALTSGRNWTNAMKRLFGDVFIEDLWRRFFCVSANLSQANLFVHESGSLMHAVRSSTAIPGILPPVFHDGDILVDGGLINNLPADLMRAYPDIGQVIAVDVGTADSSGQAQLFDNAVSGWKSLWSRLNPWGADSPVPQITYTLLRSMSISNSQSAKTTKHVVDLYLAPPVQGYGLMDFDQIHALADIGYEYALEKISHWRNDGP